MGNGNEGVIHIPQSFTTEASPSDCLMSYPGHLLGGGVTPLQSVYSTALADWATGQSLGESYSSGEMLSVYYTAPADWDS